MTNKEKYPNAEIKGPSTWGYYIVLSFGDNSIRGKTIYLVKNKPSIGDCTDGWHKTYKQAESALTNFMNETPEITLKEIKLQFEEAKKLVGNKIKTSYYNEVEICEKVFLAVDIGPDTSEVMNKEIREKGYCIGVETNKRNTFALSMCKKIETVSVTAHDGQTYTAESDGNCWKFGCARINKSLIQEAYNLFLQTHTGNRKVEKITIGKCDFTLETLKALVELES